MVSSSMLFTCDSRQEGERPFKSICLRGRLDSGPKMVLIQRVKLKKIPVQLMPLIKSLQACRIVCTTFWLRNGLIAWV